MGVHVRDLGHLFLVVCVVYRGRKTLAGVMSGIFHPDGLTEGLSGLIRGSKHYGQVRLVILDEDALPRSSCLDFQVFHEKLGLPVIYLRSWGCLDPRFMTTWRGRVVEPYGLTEGTVGRVLDSVLGEAGDMFRVARLIAGNLDLLRNV